MKLLKQFQKKNFKHLNKVFNMKSPGHLADLMPIVKFFPDPPRRVFTACVTL
jgi:hypothetical protein